MTGGGEVLEVYMELDVIKVHSFTFINPIIRLASSTGSCLPRSAGINSSSPSNTETNGKCSSSTRFIMRRWFSTLSCKVTVLYVIPSAYMLLAMDFNDFFICFPPLCDVVGATF